MVCFGISNETVKVYRLSQRPYFSRAMSFQKDFQCNLSFVAFYQNKYILKGKKGLSDIVIDINA